MTRCFLLVKRELFKCTLCVPPVSCSEHVNYSSLVGNEIDSVGEGHLGGMQGGIFHFGMLKGGPICTRYLRDRKHSKATL
jgi:hypothetical protein